MKPEIIYLPLSEIKPYENNPRYNESAVDAVAQSIKEFGFKNPIILDKHKVIIAGHTRYKASQQLGLEEVPCIIASDLTDQQAKAYRLVDNKVGELAEWDFIKLSAEIEALPDFSAEEFGFDMREIDAALNKGKEAVEDDYEEPDYIEPRIKRGEVWQLGNHRLLCGDSTKEEDVAKLMNGNKADMVFTDPPYGIDVVGDNGTIGKENKAKAGVYKKVIGDETTETARKSYDILSRYSDKQILWGGNYFVDFLPFSDGWIIWDKRVDSPSNNFADGEMAWCNFHTRVRIYHHLWMGMIQEGEREKRVHPTQKPVKVIGDVLKDFTSEHEKILDGFGGSGSTLIACEQLNRYCYMMELDEKYASVIIDRWEKFTGQVAKKIC